jgi:DivIVA domain-containing protein
VDVLWVLLGIGVLAAVAVAASGRWGGLPDDHPDRPDLGLPVDAPVGKADVDALHFSVGRRGYRMDEVDDVLDRLAAELAARDARIAELTSAAPDAHRALLVPLVDPDETPARRAEEGESRG